MMPIKLLTWVGELVVEAQVETIRGLLPRIVTYQDRFFYWLGYGNEYVETTPMEAILCTPNVT